MPSIKGVLKGVFNQESGVTLRKDGLDALAAFLADCSDAERTAAQLFDAALQGPQHLRFAGVKRAAELHVRLIRSMHRLALVCMLKRLPAAAQRK